MTRKEINDNCPAGYLFHTGQAIDMLGATEVWRIYENHPEPDVTRLPYDLMDFPDGRTAKRVPKEWGKLLYFKVV